MRFHSSHWLPGAPARRWGISRLEALFLALIGLIALGLFSAFAYRLWQVSDRVVCARHLKVLGQHIGVFHDQKKCLPASCIDKQYATWAAQIIYLPKPENNALVDWDFPKTYYQQSQQVRAAQVSWFFCPARRRNVNLSVSGDVPSNDPNGKHYPGALGDYAACAGSDGSQWDTPEANGAIIIGKVIAKTDKRIVWEGRTNLSAESLPRGKSYTILIGEKHVPYKQWGRRKVGDGSLYNGDYFGNFARVGGKGFGIAPTITAAYNRNFGSYHPGFCQFLFADGNVQAHTNEMSESVLGRLTNRFEE